MTTNTPQPANMTTIETYCPVFTGFYNTIWDESDNVMQYELDDEENFRENYPELAIVPWEFITDNALDTVDYQAGSQSVAEHVAGNFASFIKKTLQKKYSDMVSDSRYQKLVSPREYNFRNDAIDIQIDINLDLLREYLSENHDEFEDYLSRTYTSRSGFASHYPNDVESWREDTENFTELDGHYLGSILQFIAENEDSDCELSFYHHCNTFEEYMNAAYIQGDKLLQKWTDANE